MKSNFKGEINILNYPKNKNNILKYAFPTAIIIFSAIVLYSFIFMPFTNDLQVFMAAANQVKYQNGSGLLAIFQSWELKGIGNRILMYFLYALSDAVVGFENKIEFTAMVHTVYSVFTILIMLWATFLIPSEKKQKYNIFFVLFFTCFATFITIQLQAEMTCVILSFLSAALIINGKKSSLVLSGIIGASLFLFKSIFIMLYFAVLVGTMIYDSEYCKKIKNYIISAISMIASEITFVLLIKVIYPQEFKEMVYASDFQSTMLSTGSNVSIHNVLSKFTEFFSESAVATPFLILSFICTLLLLINYIKSKDWKNIIVILICWLIPFDIIILSNMYFQYHYFLLTFPGIICIITFLKNFTLDRRLLIISAVLAFLSTAACWILKNDLIQTGLINNSTVSFVIIHLFLAVTCIYTISEFRKFMPVITVLTMTVAMFFWMNYSSVIAPKYRNLTANWKKSVEISALASPKDFSDEPVLFLDSGTVSFYLDAPSYSKYFFNMPLQRYKQGDDWDIQKQEYKKLMSYSGKYIVTSNNWLDLDKYPDLKKKIDSEYIAVKNSGMYTWSVNWDFFKLYAPPDTAATNANSYVYIMERKK